MLEWKDEFSVGVAVIDKDHKTLITLLNRYLEESKTKGPLLIHNLFRDLTNYTKFHFAREEDLMAQCGYEGLEEHKEQHENIRQILQQFSDTMTKRPSKEEEKEISDFLNSWLLQHVLVEDFKYKESMAKLDQD